MATEIRLDKIRLDKTNISKDIFVNSDKPKSRTYKKLFYELVKELGFTENVRLTTGRLNKLKARIKVFNETEMLNAARNLGADAFMQGDNPSGKRYGTIDYLLRTDENVDKFLNSGTASSIPTGGFDESKYL